MRDIASRACWDKEMSQRTDKHQLREEPVRSTLNHRYVCPVCGFLLQHPPEDFNICPSCGVEFGYETESRSFSELRDEWLRSGAQWASKVHPIPSNWNAVKQLANLGTITVPSGSPDWITVRTTPNIELGRVTVLAS